MPCSFFQFLSCVLNAVSEYWENEGSDLWASFGGISDEILPSSNFSTIHFLSLTFFVNGNVPIGMVCHCFSVVTQLGTIILCDEKIV